MSSAPLRSVTLYLVGLVAIFFWWGAPDRIGRPHYPDLFHYYIGTKYFSELQYTHLYECAAKADLKSDTPTLSSSTPIRDLRTNLVSSDAAFDSEQCPTFEKKRWDGFLADIVWFRTKLGAGWHKVFLDHGFNASPYWVSVAQLLIPDGAVSDGLIKRLVRIDLCLIAAIWICIGLFFSAETFAVAAIVWGCNPIANSLWTGGGFLRHDWLLFLVLSTIALRYKRYKLSGAVFAISCCSRIFPVVAAAIWCALALLRKSDNDRRSYLTFLSSFVATCAIATLFVVTQIESSSWRGFLSNSVKHTTTRSGNLIGLPHVVDHLLSCRFGDAGLQPKSCDLDNLRVDSMRS